MGVISTILQSRDMLAAAGSGLVSSVKGTLSTAYRRLAAEAMAVPANLGAVREFARAEAASLLQPHPSLSAAPVVV